MDFLASKKIPSMIYYPIPLHLQKVFKNLDYKEGDFPISENIAERIFSLPMHPYMSENEIDNITEALHNA